MIKNAFLSFVFSACLHWNAYCQTGTELSKSDIHIPESAIIQDTGGNSVSTTTNTVHTEKINETLYYVTADITSSVNKQAKLIDIPVYIRLGVPFDVSAARNAFHWLPNMKTSPDQIVSQHVFRSPCIILTLAHSSLVLIPDLESMEENPVAPYFLDLQFSDTGICVHYGISDYKVIPHQYYSKSGKSFSLPAKLKISFYLLLPKTNDALSVLKYTNRFLWDTVAKKYSRSFYPQTVYFSRYAETGYQMAFDHYWVNVGKNAGGITLSTFFVDSLKIFRGRDSRDDLWFQSWFNNMRTAYGMYSWGLQLHKPEWTRKASSIVNLLMDAPNDAGWFPTIYNTETKSWSGSGQGGGSDLYHIPDNCWTAYWLLRFTDELKSIPGADQKLTSLADALLKIQNKDGSFPTRLNINTGLADSILNHSASSAMATWYLEELLVRKKVPAYRRPAFETAIKNSLTFLSLHVLPAQRFEDFESYFSCSPKPMHYFDSSTYMYSQNTLSIQWCAEAYLKAFNIFRDSVFLFNGEYCLNILSLYQQIWNPPFINLYAFGGFGTQNSDAEWNDARQAQFADTYLQYYMTTRNEEYLQRAVYACRASFALMVLPENKNICPENYTGTKINGEEWPGNMAENFGHDGINKRSHQSGFHWGTGSALTTAAIFKKTLGDLYVDFNSKTAVGIDGIVVEESNWGSIPSIKTNRIGNSHPLLIKSGKNENHTLIVDNRIIKIAKNEN